MAITAEGEGDELRGRLAARERENVALVQSLRALSSHCSRLEGTCQALAARVAPEATAASPPPITGVGDVDDNAEATGGKEDAEASGESPFDAALVGEDGATEEDQGAAYWRVRAVRLEQLLDVAARRNLGFEDTVARLEVQMRAMERQWDALQPSQAAKGGKRDGGASVKAPTASSAILTPPTGSRGDTALGQAREPSVSLSSRSEAMKKEVERLRGEVARRKQEAARLRSAAQRKAELLLFEKSKAAALQERLDSAASSAQELVEALAQCQELRAKAKEQARQLQDVRLAGSACHHDNVQLSFRLQLTKKELSEATSRIKALQAECQRLRARPAESASGIESPSGRSTTLKRSGRLVPGPSEGLAAAEEEAKALRRRVLQKQELIVQCKAQVASLEGELARERASALKLGNTNQQLQQKIKCQLANSTRAVMQAQTEAQALLESRQQQLDGLRASVFDVFEAFVCCFEPTTDVGASRGSDVGRSGFISTHKDSGSDSSSDEKLDKACRWTDFSLDDLATLNVAASSKRRARSHDAVAAKDVESAQLEAKAALRALGKALDRWPEDCRAEVCRVLDAVLAQRREQYR